MISFVMAGTARCKGCGSSDIWRIDERPGIVARIMRLRGRKPFQCRACGWISYRPGRRAVYRALPFPGGNRALDSAEDILKLRGAIERGSEHHDEMKVVGSSFP